MYVPADSGARVGTNPIAKLVRSAHTAEALCAAATKHFADARLIEGTHRRVHTTTNSGAGGLGEFFTVAEDR